MSDRTDPRRRTFGPVALGGLASAGLTAVGGNRDWATAPDSALAFGDTSAKVPLAGALSLVVLAAWGVLLVTRGRVRRATAVLGCAAAIGVLATAVFGYGPAAHALAESLSDVDGGPVGRTAWYWTSLVASAVSLLAAAAAVRLLPHWPEMGSRYDAPGAEQQADATGLDLWRALDDGRDPTLTDRAPTDP